MIAHHDSVWLKRLPYHFVHRLNHVPLLVAPGYIRLVGDDDNGKAGVAEQIDCLCDAK